MSPHTQPPSAKRPGATGYTLLQAVREGDLASAKQMLASNPGLLHFETYDRRTALHVACAEGHTHILRLLLSLDSDISRRDRWGRTCVTEAALNGRVQVLRMLVEQGSGDVWNGFERMVMGVRTGQALGRDLLCVVGEGGVTGAEQLVRHFCANGTSAVTFCFCACKGDGVLHV